jgi:acyl carrier protein
MMSVEEASSEIWQLVAAIVGHSALTVQVQPEASVFDLGVDSLRMVDLTIALEERFGIAEFDMLDWVDRERANADHPFTVRALASACCEAGGYLPRSLPSK